MTTKKKAFRVEIMDDLCKGCRLCVEFCPKNVLGMTTDKLNARGVQYAECLRQEDCNGCMSCVTICPDAAIELFQE